jgi:hypothetical protein
VDSHQRHHMEVHVHPQLCSQARYQLNSRLSTRTAAREIAAAIRGTVSPLSSPSGSPHNGTKPRAASPPKMGPPAAKPAPSDFKPSPTASTLPNSKPAPAGVIQVARPPALQKTVATVPSAYSKPPPVLPAVARPPPRAAAVLSGTVMYDYTAVDDQELTLARGDVVTVLERGADGETCACNDFLELTLLHRLVEGVVQGCRGALSWKLRATLSSMPAETRAAFAVVVRCSA